MFKIVTKESYLDELIKEIEQLDINANEPLSGTFYEDTFYTVRMSFEDKTYRITESELNEKIINKRYEGGSFLDYVPKDEYYLKTVNNNSSSYIEVITLNNVLSSALTDLNFTPNENQLLTKRVVLDNYFNEVRNIYQGSGFLPNMNLSEVHSKIIEEKDIYELFMEYRRKTHELNRIKSSTRSDNYESVDYRKELIKEPINSSDFIRKIIDYRDNNADYIEFKVNSKNAFLSIARFLGEEGYKYFFQNKNEEATQYNLGIRYANMEVLYGSEYFYSLNFNYYKNKVFTIDLYKKILSFWEEPNIVGDKTEEKSRHAFIVE